MRETLFRSVRAAALVPGLLVAQAGYAQSAAGSSVAGQYVCVSAGSGPCDSHTVLSLLPEGTWALGFAAGQYQISGSQMAFHTAEGNGRPGPWLWGPAEIGSGTLTFTRGDGQKVIYQKSAAPSASLAGNYVCAAAPHGCQNKIPLQIQANGTWIWFHQGGRYTVAGGRIQFSGLTGGPAGWGACEIGNGSIVFHTSSGDSQWKKQ